MYQYNALCTRVIDGDTIELVVDLGFNISNTIRGRLLNVEAPEIFSGTEKEKGQAAKAFVEALLLNQTVIVNTYKDRMSFNRWIVEVKGLDGKNINEEIANYCKTL